MAEIVRDFMPDGSRYLFDFSQCHYKNGWAQVDTKQDAPYYGIWANPLTLKIASYCEGDITVTVCANEDEFVLEMRKLIEWHSERGYFIGIDGMCSPGIIEAFKRLGFEKELH